MNKFCKQYVQHVKALFPVVGREEKKYLQKLAVQLEEYCEEHPVDSLDTLYKEYDMPEDVVNEYFSSMNTESLILRIRNAKIIKAFILCLIIALLMFSTAAATKTILYHKAYQETIKSNNGYWEEVIY